MTLGEKIKARRRELKITQSELAGSEITRNMISAIEKDKATPSLATLRYLAKALELPLSYLLSEENDLFFYVKKERMPAIKAALDTKNYNACISLILKIDTLDDELYFILAKCYFELGVSSVKLGSLLSAKKQLTLAKEYCNRTMYDTSRFTAIIPLYFAIANNINSPLLEFEEGRFVEEMEECLDYEFYKYMTLDFNFNYTNFQYKTHMEAKQLIKDRRYQDALKLLLELEKTKADFPYNAYLMFGVYADLEACYKQLYDYENAYRYSSKRISLIEGFNI